MMTTSMRRLFVSALLLATRHADAFSAAPAKTGSGLVLMTPVGPFCSFTASPSQQRLLSPDVCTLDESFAQQMAYLYQSIQTGDVPEPSKLRDAAKGIDTAVKQWESLVERLKTSTDFSTREMCMLMQANLESFGLSIPTIIVLLRWQRDAMLAIAEGEEPSSPPLQLDFENMALMQEYIPDRDLPVVALQAAGSIRTPPFQLERIKSDEGKQTYQVLLQAHSNLIQQGRDYTRMPADTKLKYLEQIVRMEDLWSEFFANFGSREAISEGYPQQCQQFLAGMSIDMNDMPVLLKETHRRMREDAERELNA